MPNRFHELDLVKFRSVLERFDFRRRIDSVHLHHTWRPRHADYRGHDTILGMWSYHTQTLGWSDIAQHVTISPAGTVWTGRGWNRPPASASGFNGNSAFGPFMIEMIGDFDRGRDRLEGDQLAATLEVIARIQARFGLDVAALRLHNTMSEKSCPGSAVDYGELLERLRDVRARVEGERGREAPAAPRPFSEQALELQQVVEDLEREPETRAVEPPDAELPEAGTDGARWFAGFDGAAAGAARGGEDEITPQMLEELAPHVVNLNQGRFSIAGRLRTQPHDVDQIFDHHLAREFEAAKEEGRPLRLLFYAHGGLVSEASGLRVAAKHVAWWRANGVYPIYFTWETGLFETLRQLLFGGQRALQDEVQARGARAAVTDRLLEELVQVPGEKVWSGMKRSAEQAVEPPPVQGGKPQPRQAGGAWYVADRLRQFCADHAQDDIELHAAGHSAGSIFHSHFLPTAFDLGVPAFKSVHFLAPAITVDSFLRRLGGRLGRKGIQQLTLFTMKRSFERADNCARVYRKSLLYLIHLALERERETPILGLQDSLLADSTLVQVFGLGSKPSAVGTVVWSESPGDSGRSASRSTSHGGFDDDPPTMNSVLRRVLGASDTAPLRREFPRPRAAERAVDPWLEPSAELREISAAFLPEPAFGNGGRPAVAGPAFPPAPVAAAPGPVNGGAGGGRRLALCVGVDAYPTAPLAGCVADARLWAQTLGQLGFDRPALLLDEQATHHGILRGLERLVEEGRPGDVLVFQFAGHGTQLRDLDGDEDDAKDEALCAHDFAAGGFVLDDDLAAVFGRLADGINFTCFIDCCHSGTITRVAVGGPSGRPADPTARPRYLAATPAMEAAHARFRQGAGQARVARAEARMREVTFSACQPHEVAWESQGQGEFTGHAVRILRAGLQGLTHRAFQQRLEAAFGPQGRQHPFLHCDRSVEESALLQPLAARPAGGPAEAAGFGGFPGLPGNEHEAAWNLPPGQQGAVAGLLQAIAAVLAARG